MRYLILTCLVLLAGCEAFMRHDNKSLDIKVIMDASADECRVEYYQDQTIEEGEDTQIISSPIN